MRCGAVSNGRVENRAFWGVFAFSVNLRVDNEFLHPLVWPKRLLPEDYSSLARDPASSSLVRSFRKSSLHLNIDSRIYPTSMDPPNQARRVPSDSSSRQGHPTLYPPPPQAVFPIPRGSNTENSSGTSSSGSKRKRAVVDDGSDADRSRTRVSSMSDFNNKTKAQVREQYNNKCWHCGASPADVCHVIGSRDNTVSCA